MLRPMDSAPASNAPRLAASMIPGPPTIYQSLLAHPRRDEYDLSSLRLAVTGAAPVPVALVEQMREELGFEVVVTAYGLTETCGILTANSSQLYLMKPESCGPLVPTVDGKVIDEVTG